MDASCRAVEGFKVLRLQHRICNQEMQVEFEKRQPFRVQSRDKQCLDKPILLLRLPFDGAAGGYTNGCSSTCISKR